MAAGSEGNARAYVMHAGTVALVEIEGVIDETFAGFGDVGEARSLVLDVGGVTRMTSFGVARWLAALEKIPRSVTESYLLRCPTIFVDQLNMVLGFGGGARVITFFAPYLCPACATEAVQVIDVVASYSLLTRGVAPDGTCPRCNAALELDESAESFFHFVGTYGATTVSADVARVLAETRRYRAQAVTADRPPRVIKLVHDEVTYFRIIGTIGDAFRARPLLVGAEGEVVIDLAELEAFDGSGLPEWKRLLKSLTAQVTAVTVVDVTPAVLQHAGDTLAAARGVAVASVLVPFRCTECARVTQTSHSIVGATWPLTFRSRVCPACGGKSRCDLTMEWFAPLQGANTRVPPATEKVVARRTELMSRAVTDANVANAGEASPTQSGELILGKYRIIRPLSAGGMAEVFLANQLGIGGFEKAVALKRIQRKLLESRQMAVDMFLNEAKIAGRLTHPNIVQVLDVGESGGALYLAMEYVRGKDLREVIKRQRGLQAPLDLAVSLHIVSEIARALHHAYWTKDMEGKRLAVVHRDVTPHNVILSFDGQVKLLDFGVAMSAVTEQSASMIVGKWAYMSPEHSSGGTLDHRSDLFSLGVILYLLITGTMPFPGTNPREIVKKTREGRFEPVLELNPDLPPELAELSTRMLANDPTARPQTGQEVAKALEYIMSKRELRTSAPQIAELLAKLFNDEPPKARRKAVTTDRDLTERVSGLAFGPGPTEPPTEDSASRSPMSFSESIGAGSASASLQPRTRFEPRVDDSVSLAPGKQSSTILAAVPPVPVPARKAAASIQPPLAIPRTPTNRAVTALPPAPVAHRAPTIAPTRSDRKARPLTSSATFAIVLFVLLGALLFLIVRYV